jgi:hypothetical protein
VCTTKGELLDCANELTHISIYTNLGACLGPTSCSGFLLIIWTDFSSWKLYFHFIISCGPTSLLESSILLFSFSGCSSTIQWYSFDFLESSFSLRIFFREENTSRNYQNIKSLHVERNCGMEIITKRGRKKVPKVIPKRREWITILCCVNSIGLSIPRFYLFKGKKKLNNHI